MGSSTTGWDDELPSKSTLWYLFGLDPPEIITSDSK